MYIKESYTAKPNKVLLKALLKQGLSELASYGGMEKLLVERIFLINLGK